MPLVYVGVAVWVIGGMLAGEIKDFPEWMMIAIGLSLYVLYAVWPIYIAWVAFSKVMTWREKGLWLFLVIFMNMIGMAMFYVFIIRRYLGIEGRIGKRDEASLDSFLKTCHLEKHSLSTGQLNVLRSYCRDRRYAKYYLFSMILLSGLMLYTAVVFFPKSCVHIFTDMAPTRLIVVDSVKNTRKEISPDPEIEKIRVQTIMMFGAMAGVMGAMSIFVVALAVFQVWGGPHHGILIRYLRATEEKQHSTTE